MLPWSSLGRFGNSSIAKATVLIPIVGTFIIYNDHIQTLVFSSKIITSISTSSVLRNAHGASASFLYFGLILTGISTFLFQVFAPQQFKKSLTPSDYAEATCKSDAIVPVRTDLSEILSEITKRKTNDSTVRDAEYLIEKIFHEIDFSSKERSSILVDLGRNLSIDGAASGRLISQEALSKNPALLSELMEAGRKAPYDIHFCNFQLQDISRPYIRLAISALITLAVTLLLVPTATTCLIIIGGMI